MAVEWIIFARVGTGAPTCPRATGSGFFGGHLNSWVLHKLGLRPRTGEGILRLRSGQALSLHDLFFSAALTYAGAADSLELRVRSRSTNWAVTMASAAFLPST